MYISRVPSFPITITYTGLLSETNYVVSILNDYAADLTEFVVTSSIDGAVAVTLPDYYSRYDAEYRVEIYYTEGVDEENNNILTELVVVDTLTIQRPYVDPVLLAESPSDLEEATQYETLARAIIDSITGGFKYAREVFEATGLGNDYLPSSLRLNKIIRIYENNICVFDTESTDPEWTNAKEYRISPDRTAITENVSGIGGYNRYQSRPTRIHNPQSDSFTPYNLSSGGKDSIDTGDNYSFFPMGWDYVVVVDAGWPVIPNDIQTATKMLYNDLKCNNLPYLNSYIKEYESGQFTIKFNDGAFTQTGNRIVDNILSNYPRTLNRIGVL
jgi:hypothetical protein